MQSIKQQLFRLIKNLTQNWYQNIQLELLQHHVKFHPNDLKSVQENEANRLCLCWPCDPSQGQVIETSIHIVEVNGVYRRGGYEKNLV